MKRTEVIVGLVSVLMLMLPILSSTLAASTNTTTTTKSEDEASMSKSNQAFTNQSRREEGQGENKEPFVRKYLLIPSLGQFLTKLPTFSVNQHLSYFYLLLGKKYLTPLTSLYQYSDILLYV